MLGRAPSRRSTAGWCATASSWSHGRELELNAIVPLKRHPLDDDTRGMVNKRLDLEGLNASQRLAASVTAIVLLVAVGLLLMPVSAEWEEVGTGNPRFSSLPEGVAVERSSSCGPAAFAAVGLSGSGAQRPDACKEAGRHRTVQAIVLGALAVAGGWIGIRLLAGPAANRARPSGGWRVPPIADTTLMVRGGGRPLRG